MADALMTEPPQAPRGRLWITELIATLLLGLAAVGAGWAAYQAAMWSSEQTFTLDSVNRIRREVAVTQNKAYLLRVIDVGMFINYMQAITQKNRGQADFLLARFRPPMKVAVNAWLATDPLKNPKAPPSPFAMSEYRLPEDAEVGRLEEEALKGLKEARNQNRTGDNYILMTVPFAIVSLFCGLSTKFWTPGIRTAIVAMAFVIFLGAAVVLALMPVT
jgi:hypothetical protein